MEGFLSFLLFVAIVGGFAYFLYSKRKAKDSEGGVGNGGGGGGIKDPDKPPMHDGK